MIQSRRKKQRLWYTGILIVCMVGFWLFENFYTPAPYTDNSAPTNEQTLPKELLPSSTTNSVVHHQFYSLSYHERYEQAEWVAYTLKKEHLTYEDRKRPYFIEDPKVRSKSADWKNYRGSGYDRGHLCPAGDRRFSEFAYNETFYTSNITPQDNDFNAGIWNRLEQKTRYWAKAYGTLYVITGGVLEKGLFTIGDEDVAIPKQYFKIIARGSGRNMKIAAFLIPHKEDSAPLHSFLVPVDEIERLTRIDFFENMADKDEAVVEKKVAPRDWKF